ncbi:MAG: response regulator transcription factor [Symbiobacteriia bacterium]
MVQAGWHVLVVEDEPRMAETMRVFLVAEGHQVSLADRASAARLGLEEADRSGHPVDLMVLDWMLPDQSGLDLLRDIRTGRSLPIIMVTARSDEMDKLLGLEMGADDYLTKPFSLRELASRMRAVMRRTRSALFQADEMLACGDLEVNLSQRRVTRGGREAILTPREFSLLATLVRRPGRVFSRLQLLEAAGGDAFGSSERAVDTHISNLRRKLEPDPAVPRYLLTVPGAGYKLCDGKGV